ncbi:hypothetical protein CICLE_v10017075mg [Citrus x clementina]|uniref:Protein NUCLEAR FUSION DEFECTIVE 6, chloroplastic/mitochondrial-like n=1 Tax=Citrus clementina TaxID=85681 RepID=V4UK30_CITCL|nr:protein NUCLEAR FUSION DEFECTIVE 6, chloroplastic/mitochondrial isoform X1 [Citrus x clementina]XP_024047015.1 protein NUCLEAR FUSION DEFECTIVE 6, chloroplastic/mitochondrial isoform X1 [Citrus x clementina]XP_024047016.1 protein NUCLEAR FUSION DEFECTIVE 6, chloroplastic/mitochondrial isoform X1 [Citrus x clementina]XP_024047017.1 protein NUCLEAR FUSION DEFECTIVE 6, chloroplastic/mitochondrial isoform X1 [Citrus x clementina]ESR62641.1 hypothetical protein CICLE_v10017075mg [Citrus x clement
MTRGTPQKLATVVVYRIPVISYDSIHSAENLLYLKNPTKTLGVREQPNSKTMSVAAARSVLRSTATTRAAVSGRLAAGIKPKAAPTSSPFRMPKQNPLSQRLFRSPVELSCCVETMLPFHTATASALLTSMLSVSRRSYGWTSEGQDKTR